MDNRHSSDSMLRYAVFALLEKMGLGACTFGMFNTGGAIMGGRVTFPRFRLHGRERIIGIVLTGWSAARCLHFWEKWVWLNAPLRSARPATRCLLFWGVCNCVPRFHATEEVNFCTRTCRLYHFNTAWKQTTMCFCLDGVYIHGLCSSGESYNEECMTGGRSGGFACGAGRRRRRLGWPWCSAAVFVLSWDVPGQSRQPAQVQVIMLGTWYDNFLEGRGAPQPALHGGNRHASHRASALTWLPNGFPQATHIFVVQVAHVQRGMTFTWYCLLFGREQPQLVHGGNEHVSHHVSVAALLLWGVVHTDCRASLHKRHKSS